MRHALLRVQWGQWLSGALPARGEVQEWCRVRGVSVHQYSYWRRRLLETEAQATEAPCDWVCMAPVEEPASTVQRGSGICVRIGQATIDVSAGFDKCLLKEVVRALSEVTPC